MACYVNASGSFFSADTLHEMRELVQKAGVLGLPFYGTHYRTSVHQSNHLRRNGAVCVSDRRFQMHLTSINDQLEKLAEKGEPAKFLAHADEDDENALQLQMEEAAKAAAAEPYEIDTREVVNGRGQGQQAEQQDS